jgi:hypothetical protein
MKALVILLLACAPSADAVYAAQQLACVDKAATLAESKACRAKVDADWKVDGGNHGD